MVARVLAAAVKIVGNAWWGGAVSLSNSNWVAIPLTLVFLVLLQKKKAGPVQTILACGVIGAILYGVLGIPA